MTSTFKYLFKTIFFVSLVCLSCVRFAWALPVAVDGILMNQPAIEMVDKYKRKERPKAYYFGFFFRQHPIDLSQVYVNNGFLVDFKDAAIPNYSGQFVVTSQGLLLAATTPILNILPDEKYLFHSSFTRGKPLLFAGNWRFKNGRLIFVDNYSGHYTPNVYVLREFMLELQVKGVDMSDVVAKVFTDYPSGKFGGRYLIHVPFQDLVRASLKPKGTILELVTELSRVTEDPARKAIYNLQKVVFGGVMNESEMKNLAGVLLNPTPFFIEERIRLVSINGWRMGIEGILKKIIQENWAQCLEQFKRRQFD